jgi:hypothetical protein
MSRTTGRVERDKRGNAVSRQSASTGDGAEPLPPDWEIRYPKSRTGVYYYNVVTHVSTWTHPLSTHDQSPSGEDRESGKVSSNTPRLVDRSDPRAGAIDSEHSLAPRPSRYEPRAQRSSDILSYKDRHYRPNDSATSRRDDRPAPPAPKDPTERSRSVSEHRRDRFRSGARRSSFTSATADKGAQESAVDSERRDPFTEVASAEARRPSSPREPSPSGARLPSPVSLLPADRRPNDNNASSAPSTLSAYPISLPPMSIRTGSSRGGGCYRKAHPGVEPGWSVFLPISSASYRIDTWTLIMDPSVLSFFYPSFPFLFPHLLL